MREESVMTEPFRTEGPATSSTKDNREHGPDAADNAATRGYDCVAAVAVDDRGYTLSESHVRVAGQWIERQIENPADAVLAELGLAGNWRASEAGNVLLLTLADATRLAETSVPGQGLSPDARQTLHALSGMCHGLNNIIDKRIRAMMVLHERVRPMKELTQSGRYSGALSPPYRFGIGIYRR